ncbi:MAG TPA: sporulation protein YqfC [Syntrophomonas sp.]|jgi:sporulation protein YqfC|nr:sporulation protein YqfC [Syntrophomonas sp.]
MEKRREMFGKAMADFLEIPKDLVMDIPKVTVIGRNELYLENHRGIIEYSLTRVRINLSRGFIEIEGQNLEIKALLPEELSLYGDIKSVKYVD